MNENKELVWAVELVENGERKILLDYKKRSTPDEARDAAAAHMGIPWKELERRGAKVIQQEMTVHPGDPENPFPEE
jgi:hypothetical protein